MGSFSKFLFADGQKPEAPVDGQKPETLVVVETEFCNVGQEDFISKMSPYSEIVARAEGRGAIEGPLTWGSDTVLEYLQKGWARVVPRNDDLEPISDETYFTTLRLGRKTKCRPLPRSKDPLARAQEEKHITGEHTERIRRAKPKTPKHKPRDEPTQEERRKKIQARRAEAMRSKNWMANITDIEHEGLLNGKFGLNTETKESMEKLFTETLDKMKDIANNNKIVLQHIFKLENAADVIAMLAAVIIALVGARAIPTPGGLLGFIIKLVAGTALFKSSFGFVEAMLSDMCEVQPDEVELAMNLEEINHHIEVCEQAGMKAPPTLIKRRSYLLAHPEEEPAGLAAHQDEAQGPQEGERMRHEGLIDKPAAVSHILSGFINGVIGVGIGFLLSGAQKGQLKKLMAEHKLLNDVKSLLNEIVGFIAKSFDAVFGTSFSKHFVKNGKLETWGTDVASLYEEFAGGKLSDATQGAKRVYQLRMRAIDIKKSDMTMTPSAASYMHMMMQLLTTMENYYGHQGVSPTDRMEPVIVCFKGASGIGKSTITPAFIDAVLCKSILTKEQVDEYINNKDSQLFQYLPEEEHVNGYTGQEALVVEDMGQWLTTRGQKDDMFPIIRFKNTAPCRLNAASLEKKGVLTFTSSLVVCNTNLEQFYPPSILSPEAFLRRFDFWIKMVPKVEYSKDHTKDLGPDGRRLDRDKCDGVLDTEACEFHLEEIPDFSHPSFVTKEVVTWDQLIKKVCALVRVQQERHKQLVAARNERIKKIVEEMEEEVVDTIAKDDCKKKVMTHEGLFAPIRHIAGIFRRKEKRSSVLERAKSTVTRLAEWFRKITSHFVQRIRDEIRNKWIRRVFIFLIVFVAVVGSFKLINWIFRSIPIPGRRRVKEFNDPALFVESVMRDAFLASGVSKGGKEIPHAPKALWKGVKQGIEQDGTVQMFGKRLRCKKKDFDKYCANYEAQLFEQPNPQDLPFYLKMAKSITTRNQWHLYDYEEDIDFDSKISGGIVTMICGRTALLNAHFVNAFRERYMEDPLSEILLVQHGNVMRQVRVPLSVFVGDENVVMDRDRDIAFVRFGTYMPVCRDIRQFFASEETTHQNRDFETSLIALRTPREVERMELRKRSRSGVVHATDGSVHSQTFSYYADTISGDCGSLVMYTGTYSNHTERIIGVHMGGNNDGPAKRGFASILTREVIESRLVLLEAEPKLGPLEVTLEQGLLEEETSHLVVRTVDTPVYQPMKTNIVESSLHGMLEEPSKSPAILNKKALRKALKKQSALNVTLDEDALDAAAEAVFRVINKGSKNRGLKLTFEQAIVGHPDLHSFKKIPRNTSPGWPLCHDPEVKDGKKSILGYGEEYDLDNPKLREIKHRVEQAIARLERGDVPDVVFMDMMKDETRPNESVAAMKTRLIAACPLEWTIIYRMYYGATCNDIIESRLDNECCVGINPLSDEWDTLSRMLSTYGEHCVAGDFSQFDNSQTCQAIEATMGVMNRLTGLSNEKDLMVLRGLSVTLSQAQHIVGNTIFENMHGMPSGNPMTTIINCIFGMIMFRMAWMILLRDQYKTRRLALQGFENNVRLKMYGDDNIQNISKWAIRWYNQRSLMEVFPLLGLIYTSDVKSDLNPPKWRKLEMCTFLKRGFLFNTSLYRWVAPLDRSTIFSMLDWTKKGGSADSITLDNCNNAMREWVLHGKSYYQEQTRRLEKIVESVYGPGHFMPLPYKEALVECVNHVPEWVALHA